MQEPPRDAEDDREPQVGDHLGGQLADLQAGMTKLTEAAQAERDNVDQLIAQFAESRRQNRTEFDAISKRLDELMQFYEGVEKVLSGMDHIAKVAYFRGYDRGRAEFQRTDSAGEGPQPLQEHDQPADQANHAAGTGWLRQRPARAALVAAMAVVLVAVSAAAVWGAPRPSTGTEAPSLAEVSSPQYDIISGVLRSQGYKKAARRSPVHEPGATARTPDQRRSTGVAAATRSERVGRHATDPVVAQESPRPAENQPTEASTGEARSARGPIRTVVGELLSD